jgi:hypothetical protein
VDTPHKATFYISHGTLDALEELKLTLARRVGYEHRTSVTRSLLVEIAVKNLTKIMQDQSGDESLNLLGLGPRPYTERSPDRRHDSNPAG